jgi:hypothetical protein
MGFYHSVGSEKAGCIGSLVLCVNMATKSLFLHWSQWFHEFVCGLGRLGLTYFRECRTKMIDDGEENKLL